MPNTVPPVDRPETPNQAAARALAWLLKQPPSYHASADYPLEDALRESCGLTPADSDSDFYHESFEELDSRLEHSEDYAALCRAAVRQMESPGGEFYDARKANIFAMTIIGLFVVFFAIAIYVIVTARR